MSNTNVYNRINKTRCTLCHGGIALLLGHFGDADQGIERLHQFIVCAHCVRLLLLSVVIIIIIIIGMYTTCGVCRKKRVQQRLNNTFIPNKSNR